METKDQPVTTDSGVEGNPVLEAEEEFISYDNSLEVQQPPVDDTTFHVPMEGQPSSYYWVFSHPSDDTVGAQFAPNDLLWRNSLG